jgi:hypothetical protein
MAKSKNAWVQNDFIDAYLTYVENTESPKLMHIWSALTGVSAAMGRHIHLPFGIGDIHPNIYVLLVGPPGTRKSSAIDYMRKIVSKNTAVRFAPDDTGAQRQGLISAMEGTTLDSHDQEFEIMENAGTIADITDVGHLTVNINGGDTHTMFACASEFGTFMGEGNANMARFLIKTYDGEDYEYKLKLTQQILRDPLMTIIGGTTTADIAKILPADAIGQGFMSRWLLVFSPQKEKKVAEPSLDEKAKEYVTEVYNWLSYEMRGEMKEAPEARRLLIDMYEGEDVDLNDSRFLYYAERRHTHLKKLSMLLAAVRRSFVITMDDVQHADTLLSATEEFMPEALGEFGLSPIGEAKQKMIEFLQHAKDPVPQRLLYQIMQRDISLRDFSKACGDLTNTGKIIQVDMDSGVGFMYKSELHQALQELERLVE